MLDLPKRVWAYFACVAIATFTVVFFQAQHSRISFLVLAFGILLFATDMAPITMRDVTYTVSHIIATSTLAIPVLIISETSLSFLGLGIRPPAISWGVLLQEAQNIQTVAQAPWLLLPGVVVIVAVLAFNLVGDGLRDAADPYGH